MQILVSVFAPLIVLLMKSLPASSISTRAQRGVFQQESHTFGKFKLGIITLCNALGACLGSLRASPPG